MGSPSFERAHTRSARWAGAALSLTCAACSGSSAPSIGRCTKECVDEPTVERNIDAAMVGPVTVEAGIIDAAPLSPIASDEAADGGAFADFEQRLNVVDEQMDYGYDGDAVLHELSRTAGRAGTAQCLCYSPESNLEFLTGCALDEGTVELGSLPIDFEEAMDCVIAQVGRTTFELYAACTLATLQSKIACYAERQGSGECVDCARGLNACPHSEDIAAAGEVCSGLGESRERTRRLL